MIKAISLAAAGLMLAAGSAHAQEASPEPTMQDDLDCAIFLAATLGSMPEDADPEAKAGIMAGTMFFVGRYEGAGGTDLRGDMLARAEGLGDADLERMKPGCLARMQGISTRLIDAGGAIVQAEKAREKLGK